MLSKQIMSVLKSWTRPLGWIIRALRQPPSALRLDPAEVASNFVIVFQTSATLSAPT